MPTSPRAVYRPNSRASARLVCVRRSSWLSADSCRTSSRSNLVQPRRRIRRHRSSRRSTPSVRTRPSCSRRARRPKSRNRSMRRRPWSGLTRRRRVPRSRARVAPTVSPATRLRSARTTCRRRRRRIERGRRRSNRGYSMPRHALRRPGERRLRRLRRPARSCVRLDIGARAAPTRRRRGHRPKWASWRSRWRPISRARIRRSIRVE